MARVIQATIVGALGLMTLWGVPISVLDEPRVEVDHHVHLLSPTLIADWKSTGMPFSRSDEHYASPTQVLKNLQVQQACLVSMAHLYSSPMFEQIVHGPDQERERVQAENDFIAACVSQHPQRLLGFYSLHPTREWVFRLRERYLQCPGMIGWKMHLPACQFDWADPGEIEKLRASLAWCEANHQAILIHIFSGDEPSYLADRFWELLQPHPKLTVIVAHCGSSGGYNQLSHAVLTGYLDLLNRSPEFRQAPIYFDLSGAALVEETEGLPATPPENCQQLAQTMRQIGLSHFLYASDYPVFSSSQMATMLDQFLQLTESERAEILGNRLPNWSTRFVRD